jgi:hypothetical protein
VLDRPRVGLAHDVVDPFEALRRFAEVERPRHVGAVPLSRATEVDDHAVPGSRWALGDDVMRCRAVRAERREPTARRVVAVGGEQASDLVDQLTLGPALEALAHKLAEDRVRSAARCPQRRDLLA